MKNIVEEKYGAFYITMGNPGFNSPANNRGGYKTREAAEAASERYRQKGIAAAAKRQA